MDVFAQIVASGLTLGAMYAVSTVGLALVYGSLNMLNMSHGALLALGGYVCLYVMERLGLPGFVAVPAAIVVCGAVGLAIYVLAARPMPTMRRSPPESVPATWPCRSRSLGSRAKTSSRLCFILVAAAGR